MGMEVEVERVVRIAETDREVEVRMEVGIGIMEEEEVNGELRLYNRLGDLRARRLVLKIGAVVVMGEVVAVEAEVEVEVEVERGRSMEIGSSRVSCQTKMWCCSGLVLCLGRVCWGFGLVEEGGCIWRRICS
jgi:hypothetical protein